MNYPFKIFVTWNISLMRVHRDGLNTHSCLCHRFSWRLRWPLLSKGQVSSFTGCDVISLTIATVTVCREQPLTRTHSLSDGSVSAVKLPSIPWDEEKPWPADYSQESNVSPLHYSSLQCHMILQKSENEDSLLKKQKILLLSMLSSPWWIEKNM